MPSSTFDSCIQRIYWAGGAARSLDEEYRLWLLADQTHQFEVEYCDAADIHAVRYRPQPVFARWSILASNIVHQTRAALDNLVSTLVIANGKTPTTGAGGNKFPIYSDATEDSFQKRSVRDLAGVAPQFVSVIEGLQPYNNPSWPSWGGVHPLRRLADWSNEDKHRLLRTVVSKPAGAPDASLDTGPSSAVEDGELLGYSGRKGEVVAWYRVTPPGPHTDLTFNFNEGFAQLGHADGTPVSSALSLMITVVHWIALNFDRMLNGGVPVAPILVTDQSMSVIYALSEPVAGVRLPLLQMPNAGIVVG